MASITNQPKNRKTIQFIAADGKRRSIRLGPMSKSAAQAIKVHVERLVSASISGHVPTNETTRWVAEQDAVLVKKLAKVGLVQERDESRLQDYVDRYIDGRSDVKESSLLVYGHTRRNLIEFFGAGKLIREITPGDADAWRIYLVAQGLADNTVRRRCGFAKQFFRAAVRSRLIPDNPFQDLTGVVKPNTDRYYFVSRKDSEAVLKACPNAQWKLLFALSRYGGLRCPSEHLALRWSDINWAEDRMTITASKTEHHAGQKYRFVPLFPELRPHLEAALSEARDKGVVPFHADDDSPFIITRYRSSRTNLRTQLLKIIKRAGVQPWPKLFQNLRSTRETELAEQFPIQVVCSWIGNSPNVAAKHYLQTTEDHFARAIEPCSALHNPVHNIAKSG